jgi:hypothetical protein
MNRAEIASTAQQIAELDDRLMALAITLAGIADSAAAGIVAVGALRDECDLATQSLQRLAQRQGQ